MKKKVVHLVEGRRADVGEYKIYRLLPNHLVRAVGPFVFLDYAPPVLHAADEAPKVVNGSGAHPHRGIATLTYVLNGEADHFDSNGHHARVYSGGAQWMKAGTGIIHDEAMNPDPYTSDRLTQAFQFWVNLPAKNKAEQPDYLPVQADEIPKIGLENNAGWLKVVAGEYASHTSPIPAFLDQFIYHIHLQPGKTFLLDTQDSLEYAAFLPAASTAIINDVSYDARKTLFFDTQKSVVEIKNPSDVPVDIIVFGGAPYTEPFIARGSFVMNTAEEIDLAYSDYFEGRYGTINYKQKID
ncbi:pirin family protein [Chitinophaga sp. 212800010-3]|uniref:pirin family protein n=1 Tax=unclassified Chitinophaga TaxID=2619133 RepID=UPI002DEB855E|nr:Pirin family protein [Chitinophaga sp. 212800010-3]